MQKTRSTALILVMGILIFPWKLLDFCATHPFGHTHHHHDGPSPCELRAQFKDVTSIWPPMDCYKISVHSDDFQQSEKVKPALPALALEAVFFEVIEAVAEENSFILLPDPRSNSDPPLKDNPLRGPPLS